MLGQLEHVPFKHMTHMQVCLFFSWILVGVAPAPKQLRLRKDCSGWGQPYNDRHMHLGEGISRETLARAIVTQNIPTTFVASNLEAMASILRALASNLIAMASNLIRRVVRVRNPLELVSKHGKALLGQLLSHSSSRVHHFHWLFTEEATGLPRRNGCLTC